MQPEPFEGIAQIHPGGLRIDLGDTGVGSVRHRVVADNADARAGRQPGFAQYISLARMAAVGVAKVLEARLALGAGDIVDKGGEQRRRPVRPEQEACCADRGLVVCQVADVARIALVAKDKQHIHPMLGHQFLRRLPARAQLALNVSGLIHGGCLSPFQARSSAKRVGSRCW